MAAAGHIICTKPHLSVRGPSPANPLALARACLASTLQAPPPKCQLHLTATAMPITALTPDLLRQRQDIRTQNENALAACTAVGDIVRSTLGPVGPDFRILDKLRGGGGPPPTLIPLVVGETAMNPQTEAASLNAGDDPMAKNVDDNADLIDENGALAVKLEDGGDALDCGVCYLPLRPPIFQCENGHVLCFPCRRKLESTGNGKCHVCRVDLDEDDSRCHAMERVVESIRVRCPNAAHGCTAKLTYYDRSSHRTVCPHARYSCSGHGCGFVGSAGALLDHVASVHTNNEAMQQFWTEELSSLMARLKLHMAAADIGMGVRPSDVELVMSQAGVSMDKVAKALKESDGDVVTAIVELTY